MRYRPSIADTLHAMAILPFVKYLGPARFRRRLLDLWPDKRVQRLKRLVDMVYARTSEILEAKRVAILKGDEALIGQIGEGRDVMSILRLSPLMSQVGVAADSLYMQCGRI